MNLNLCLYVWVSNVCALMYSIIVVRWYICAVRTKQWLCSAFKVKWLKCDILIMFIFYISCSEQIWHIPVDSSWVRRSARTWAMLHPPFRARHHHHLYDWAGGKYGYLQLNTSNTSCDALAWYISSWYHLIWTASFALFHHFTSISKHCYITTLLSLSTSPHYTSISKHCYITTLLSLNTATSLHFYL